MKRIIALVVIVILVVASLTACGEKPKTSAEDIAAGTYDWEDARERCISDLAEMLNVIVAGDTNTYEITRTKWLPRIESSIQLTVFPNMYPPQGCSSTVTYMGYSAPEYNSDKAEYIMYNARCLNNETLASADFKFVIKLGRGKDGYIITGFSKEEVPNVK